jgi:glycosyltransferase involved in cell wall biosynthesis
MIIVFLGKRGGALHLLSEVVSDMSEYVYPELIDLILSVEADANLPNYVNIRKNSISLPHSLAELLTPSGFYNAFVATLKISHLIFTTESQYLLQLMPNPFDWIIDILCNINHIEIIRAVHDIQPHYGEKWPTKRSMQIRIKRASGFIVYSKYIRDKLQAVSQKPSVLAKLNNSIKLKTQGSISPEIVDIVNSKKGKVTFLCIGRIFEYKGFDDAIKVISNSNLDCNLIIAGDGKIKQDTIGDHIFVWNKWLSEEEFLYLIRSADVILLPYREASQSGIIPIAAHENKIILHTYVGGLLEQVAGYELGYGFEPNDLSALGKAIKEAFELILNGHRNLYRSNAKATKNVLPTTSEALIQIQSALELPEKKRGIL